MPDFSSAYKPLLDFVKWIFDRWDRSVESRRRKAGALFAIQQEITRNWTAIKAAERLDGGPQQVTNSLTADRQQKLAESLDDQRALLETIAACYEGIEEGVHTLPTQPWSEADRAKYDKLALKMTEASRKILAVLERDGLLINRLSDADCVVPDPWRQLEAAELSGDEQEAFLERWEVFCDGLENDSAHAFSLEEWKGLLERREVSSIAKLREWAKAKHGDMHSFEVEPGLFEFFMSDRVRFLYGIDLSSQPVLIDVVRLSGLESGTWTLPERRDVARCRLSRI